MKPQRPAAARRARLAVRAGDHASDGVAEVSGCQRASGDEFLAFQRGIRSALP
jgi:hypothetical protein